MIDDPYLLCQYKLATEVWVRDLNKSDAERILTRAFIGNTPLHLYYAKLLRKYFKKTYVGEDDGVLFERLPTMLLNNLATKHGIPTTLHKAQWIEDMAKQLGRQYVTTEDHILISDLPANDLKQLCSRYLFPNGALSDILADLLSKRFRKEWLSAEEIEGTAGYSSKTTLLFNGNPHTIYYGHDGTPIIYKKALPKQLLFLEQFLRMTKEGGLIFTVLDIGALNNIGDDYLRKFLQQNARLHAAVELLHGAFKAAAANVRTVILMYEKMTKQPKDYDVFLAVPQYLGYRLNDKDVPPIRENDLGKVLCDYSVSLGCGPLLPNCGGGNGKSKRDCRKGNCGWDSERGCDYWLSNVDTTGREAPSERLSAQSELLSLSVKRTRTVTEGRVDPKFFVYERRLKKLLARLAHGDVQPISKLVAEPIYRGVQPFYDDADGTVPVLKTVDIKNRKIDWDSCRKVTRAFYDDNKRGQLARGDIVVTSTGEGSWGRAAIVDVARAFADGHITILKVKSTLIDPYAVLAFLWSEFGVMQFEQRVRGSTGQTEVYPQDIERIRIVIPPVKEMATIRAKILQHFKLLDRAEKVRSELVGYVGGLLEDGK